MFPQIQVNNKMIKNLLALLLALQKATLDANQRLLLTQLGNKLEAISRKSSAPEEDWKNAQTKINQLLEKNSTLAEQYQQILAQLQAETDEELVALLPSRQEIDLLRPHRPATLGQPPTKDGNIDSTGPNGVNIIKIIDMINIISHDENSETKTSLLAKIWNKLGGGK